MLERIAAELLTVACLGKAVHEEIRAVVKANAAGWVDTVIAQPGSSTPAKKRVYVMAVTIDGKPGIIGSGFYH